MIMGTKAAIYLRRSTDRQDQSLGDQRKANLAYAQKHGLEVVQEYVDDALSGTSTKRRLGFQEMLEEAGEAWTVLLVYDVSRFGRTGPDEAGHHRHLLTKKGVEIRFVAEGLRGDRSDRVMLPLKDWMAEQYSVDLSRSTLRGQISHVEKGRYCGGRPPFGYDVAYYSEQSDLVEIVRFLPDGQREIRDPDGTVRRVIPKGARLPVSDTGQANLVPGNPDHIRVVQRMFRMYRTGEAGIAAIASRLNADGIPSVRGGRWSAGSIREILRNPAFRGAAVWNRVTYGKFHRVSDKQATERPDTRYEKVERNPEDQWIVVEGAHEPLVTPEEFAQTKRVMRSRAGALPQGRRRMTTGRSTYLLSGLIVCRRCGMRWEGRCQTKGKPRKDGSRVRTRYYACGSYVRNGPAVCRRNYIPQGLFEETVMDEAAKFLEEYLLGGGRKILEAMLKEAAQPAGTAETEAALVRRVRDLEAQRDGYVESLTPALVSILEPKIVELQRQIEDTQADLDERRTRRLDDQQVRKAIDGLMEKLGGVRDLLQKGTLIERRDVLRALVEEIAWDGDEGVGELVFRAVPRLDETSPELLALGSMCSAKDAKTSCSAMAGGGFEPPTSGL